MVWVLHLGDFLQDLLNADLNGVVVFKEVISLILKLVVHLNVEVFFLLF